MKLDVHEHAIEQAKVALKITDVEFARLPNEQAELVMKQIEEKFVDGHNWSWWWEHLRQTDYAALHAHDAGFKWLSQILPTCEATVWFVIEPSGLQGRFLVYETRAAHVQPVLGESIFFEYYLVAKDLSWLIGENHHGCFFCTGEPITTRLKNIVEQNPDEWQQAHWSD